MKNPKPYIRRKGNKFVIERKFKGTTQYLASLPIKEKAIWELILYLRPGFTEEIASQKHTGGTNKGSSNQY